MFELRWVQYKHVHSTRKELWYRIEGNEWQKVPTVDAHAHSKEIDLTEDQSSDTMDSTKSIYSSYYREE